MAHHPFLSGLPVRLRVRLWRTCHSFFWLDSGVLALTVDQTEILRDLATVIQKQADTIRRLELLEDELRTAKTSVYRIVWVIMVTLLGQVLSKIDGISAVIEALK